MFNDFTNSENTSLAGSSLPQHFSQSIRNKVIAISGGALGIGLATAELLAVQGAKLSIADNQSGPLEEARAKLLKLGATSVIATVVDVRDSAQVNGWIEHTVSHFGRLDGAANMAGVFRCTGPISQSDPDNGDWDLVYDVNVKGLYKCLKAQIKAMEDAGIAGSIVNASSVMGLRAGPTYAAYCSSKHAALGITRVAAKEAGPKNIRVNAICPGVIKTTMISNMEKQQNIVISPKNPMDRAGQPEEVAKLISFLLSDDASYITGAAMSIDGGSYP